MVETAQAITKRYVLTQEFVQMAQLCGSRGRAKLFGHAPPVGSDFDIIVYTNTPNHRAYAILQELSDLIGFPIREWRSDGGVSLKNGVYDLMIKPTANKLIMLRSWQLQEEGVDKEEAWKQAWRWAEQELGALIKDIRPKG